MIIFYHGNHKGCLMKVLSTINDILNPLLDCVCTKTRVESCLKQDKFSFDHGKVVSIYIVYEINKNFNISGYPTLEKCLFSAIKLTKHPDIDLYKYSGYAIGFDRKGPFSIGDKVGRNVIIFGVDMSLYPYVDSKRKDILILGKGPTSGLEHTLTAEKLYSINFTEYNTNFLFKLAL